MPSEFKEVPLANGRAGAPLDGGTIAINRNNLDEPDSEEDAHPGIAQLEPGTVIGAYEVRGHIGDGGMAAVYKAWHTGLHRFEALKIPRHQHTYGPEASFLRRLLAEARTSARLHHPHIVAIHNVSEPDAPLQYFAMEYVRGCDLARLLEARGRLPVSEALPILYQVASALDYAHSQNVIHRDVKPGNILLQRPDEVASPQGGPAEAIERSQVEPNTTDPASVADAEEDACWHAKVVDFGISRAGEDTGGTRLTRSGMIVGTPEYMSPEQSGSGAPVGFSTDIYSLAVVAYEMLCGTPPFTAGDGVSRISILMKHVNEAPASLTRHLPALPDPASEAILRALAKQPDDRFASCTLFVNALAEALVGVGAGELGAAFIGRNTPRSDTVQRRAALLGQGAGNSSTQLAPDTQTLEPGTAAKVRAKTRNSSLLAGLGGLIAGAAIVFGWLGSENYRAEQLEKKPQVAATTNAASHSAHASAIKPRHVVAAVAVAGAAGALLHKHAVTSAPRKAPPVKIVPPHAATANHLPAKSTKPAHPRRTPVPKPHPTLAPPQPHSVAPLRKPAPVHHAPPTHRAKPPHHTAPVRHTVPAHHVRAARHPVAPHRQPRPPVRHKPPRRPAPYHTPARHSARPHPAASRHTATHHHSGSHSSGGDAPLPP